MKYIEWRNEFENYICSLDKAERDKVLSYYAEMYADRRDAGFTEEQVIAEFGAPYDAAKKILDGEGEIKREEKKADSDKSGVFLSEGAIDALEISGALGNSFVTFYDEPQIKVIYPTDSFLGYKVVQQGGKVIITHKSVPKFGNIKNKIISDMKIFIPRDLTPDCKIELTAGKLSLGAGDYGKISAQIEAGVFDAENINCSDAGFLTDAGKIKLSGIVCHRLKAEVNAGKLTAKNICGSTAEFRVSAGAADVYGIDCKRTEIGVSAGNGTFTMCGREDDYDALVNKMLGTCNLEARSAGCDRSIKVDVSLGNCAVKFEK